VGQADGAQGIIEASRQCSCRSLYVQTETGIADQVRCFQGWVQRGAHK
jgi:hypothetical protein